MLFKSLSIALAALAVPFVSAITINPPPANISSADPVTITWSAVQGDPQSFSIFLINEDFNDSFGIANNVATGAMTITLTLPVVPVGGGYTIQFTNNGNQSDIFAQTGGFSIGATVSTTTSSGTSTIPSTASTVSPSTGITTIISSTSSDSGTSSSSGSGSGTSSGTSTGTSPTASPTTFNNNGAFKLGSANAGIGASAVLLVLGVLGL